MQQAAQYALGALRGDELKKFEAYLRSASAEELRELSELMATASLLPLALEKTSPPDAVKSALLDRVVASERARESAARRTETVPQVSAPLSLQQLRPWLWWGVGVTVVVMIIGFSIYMLRLVDTVEVQNRRFVAMQDERDSLAGRITELKDALQQKEALLGVLAAQRVEIAIMSGLEPHLVGYGKVIWDPERRVAILQVSNLPPVPADKDYQLWVVKGQQKISAGVFSVASEEPGFFKVENLAVANPREIAAFAITLEPKGGAPQPTGAMYLVGSPRL
jgi:anti-sigma-K factor RskA